MTTGTCRCGAVTYRLTGDALPATYACHCLDCQTWSGSAFGEHALIPEESIAIEGETATYVHAGEGFTSEQVACPTCFTRIFNRNSAVPGLIVLRAGTLDASDRLAPIAHMWIKRKQDWIALPEGVPSWPETPTPEQYGEAIRRAQG